MRQMLNSGAGSAGDASGRFGNPGLARPEAPPTRAGAAPGGSVSPPTGLGPRQGHETAGVADLADAGGPGGEGVVLIHGLGHRTASLWLLARRLAHAGFAVARVGYLSLHIGLEAAVALVAARVAEASAGWRRVHLDGHSLGGLIARRIATAGADPRLGRVLQLGTLNAGAPIADWLLRWRLARWIFGPVLGDMAGERAPAVALGTVGAVAGRLGSLSGDGLVPVASALAGAGQRAEIACLHTWLPLSAPAARLTERFLREGRFA